MDANRSDDVNFQQCQEGADHDLPILAGDSTDFTFTDKGRLTDDMSDGNGTGLDVAPVERLEFDDGTFDFGDLF